MISKNSIKRINSLRIKKFRNESGLFIAEGARLVDEIIDSSLEIVELYHTSNWKSSGTLGKLIEIEVDDDEMKRISGLTSPPSALAIVKIPSYELPKNILNQKLTLALDDIQDPGNLGTIIRLADWFGIDYIICSNNTVDAFSPKVVQASMGSISRVKVIYCDLPRFLNEYNNVIPVYGTFMEGEDIYRKTLDTYAIIVMGNEGNGISSDVEKYITNKIHIPSFASNRGNVESLNVAVATSIVCSEFKGREYRSKDK